MKILIIEDDEIKLNRIQTFLNQELSGVSIEVAMSLHSGLERVFIEKSQPDLIILDMTLPTFDISDSDDGGKPQAYGGREFLTRMDNESLIIPVLIVTQYQSFGKAGSELSLDQLNQKLQAEHPKNYKGTVYYNASIDGWKKELKTLLDKTLGK